MKKSLCLITLLLVASSSLFSSTLSAEPLSAALNECRQQQNALKRLVCYDEINLATTAAQPAAPGKNNAAEVRSNDTQAQQTTGRSLPVAKAPAPASTDDFGLEHRKVSDEQADQLYLTVSSISYSPRKELIVEFDNGQIWRQNSSGSYPIAVGERHNIKRGMLGSFTLGNNENNRTIRVRRVQ